MQQTMLWTGDCAIQGTYHGTCRVHRGGPASSPETWLQAAAQGSDG